MAGGGATGSGGVASQAGVLEGLNPTHYNAADPIVLFIIQVRMGRADRAGDGRAAADGERRRV